MPCQHLKQHFCPRLSSKLDSPTSPAADLESTCPACAQCKSAPLASVQPFSQVAVFSQDSLPFRQLSEALTVHLSASPHASPFKVPGQLLSICSTPFLSANCMDTLSAGKHHRCCYARLPRVWTRSPCGGTWPILQLCSSRGPCSQLLPWAAEQAAPRRCSAITPRRR